MSFLQDMLRGFARKIGYIAAALLVGAVLSIFGIGKAQAACNTSTKYCDSKGEAYDKARSVAQTYINSNASTYSQPCYTNDVVVDSTRRKVSYGIQRKSDNACSYYVSSADWLYPIAQDCPVGSGKVWDAATKACTDPPCSPNDPPLSGGYMKYTGDEPGYQTCSGGCEYNPSSMTYQTGTVDGIKYVSLKDWIPSGASCTVGPNDGYIPPSDTDNDGISDGNDSAPNNPGQSGGGSSNPNTGQPPSGNGDGNGDGSGNGNQSSGGGNCQSPPSSNGDQILAQAAYQTWATRCAVEGLKAEDGKLHVTVDNPSSGGGSSTDMTETNGILSTIKSAVQSIKDFVAGITNEAGSLDQSKGADTDPSSVWSDEDGGEGTSLDSSGFGWGRSCPALPTVSIGGVYTGKIDDGTLCTIMQMVGALILLVAYFHAATIIGR